MLDPGALILSQFLMISRPLYIHFLVMGSQFWGARCTGSCPKAGVVLARLGCWSSNLPDECMAMVQGGRSATCTEKFTMFEGAKLLNHQSSNGIVKVLSHTVIPMYFGNKCRTAKNYLVSPITKLAWIGAQSVYGKFLTTATETRNIGIGLSMSFPFEECPVWPTPFLFECK